MLTPEEIPDDLAPAISSREMVTRQAGTGEIEYVSKVRFWNKNDAIKTLFQLRGDNKINDKNLNVKGDLAITRKQQESELSMKHLTKDEFERSNELAESCWPSSTLDWHGRTGASGPERFKKVICCGLWPCAQP